MTPLIQKAVKFAPDPETALWFDVGQIDVVSPPSVGLPDDFWINLPYKRTGIVGISPDGIDFAFWLWVQHEGSLIEGKPKITVSGCSMLHNKYFPNYAYTTVKDKNGNNLFQFFTKRSEKTEYDAVKPIHKMVVEVLKRISNRTEGYRPTPKNTFINRKRQTKGKTLLFDWHTVTIAPSKEKNESLGGTHASPRRHQARGHWRKYKSGKQIWIKECWKGDASRGVVFKDYKMCETSK